MRNKIIALIMVIPLVLMVCVFSLSNVASYQIDIPVSDVTLFNDRQEVINLAEGNTLQINAQVMPINAKNKGLTYSYDRVGDNPLPNLTISQTGLIEASGYGSAKITVTSKDGAYKKSFIINVTSTLATDVILNLSTTQNIFVGDTFSLLGSVIPSDALDKNLKYYSSDSTIVRVNQITGECRAISSGRVNLRAVLDNGINGKIEKLVEVLVYPSNSSNPITFNGKTKASENIFESDYVSLMEVNFTDLYAIGERLSVNDILLNYDTSLVASVMLEEQTNNNGIYKFLVKISGLTAEEFDLKASLNYANYSSYVSEISLQKIIDAGDIVLSLNGFKEHVKVNSTNSFSLNITPADFTGYNVNVYFEEDNITLA